MKKVLWIEDDAYVIDAVMEPLRREGVEVANAVTCAEALEKLLGGEEFDAFVVDLIMPMGRLEGAGPQSESQDEYPGVSLVRHILSRRPRAAIVVLSVVRSETDLQTLGDLGVKHILAKPVLPSKLRDVVMEAIEEG